MTSLQVPSDRERRFLAGCRVAHLATADGGGEPHVLPVCFALGEAEIFIAVDRKPKREPPRRLKRLRNIAANPQVALVADRYDDDDWSRLGWVMLRGRADILERGAERDRAQDLLIARYRQYRDMDLVPLPVIALRIARVTSWGALEGEDESR